MKKNIKNLCKKNVKKPWPPTEIYGIIIKILKLNIIRRGIKFRGTTFIIIFLAGNKSKM